MKYIRDHFPDARLRAILELEREQENAYMPNQMWEFDMTAIDRADLSPVTKIAYRRELKTLLNTGIDPFDFEALLEYAISLNPSHRLQLKRALRHICLEYERSAKEKTTPENLATVQALVMRLEAVRDSVKVQADTGSPKRIWLSPSQVRYLTGICANDLEGKRDWIILALLVGAGLSRTELTKITFDALQKERTKNGEMRDFLKFTGYGGRERKVPISSLLADRIGEWNEIVGDGYIARSYDKKKLGQSITTTAVHQIVRKYGVMIGVPNLKAEDLARTYAQLAYDSGLSPSHIKELMGHVRLSTTQRHLNLKVDLGDISGDFVPLVE